MESSSDITGVIVADDDPVIRGILRSKLEAVEQDVFLASDGLEAVDLASRVQAALIMLDLKMPRMNGLVACQRIRQLRGHARTPIVMLTSTIGRDAEAAATRVGATAFLTKPFRSAQLLQVLSRYLPMNNAMRQLIRYNADRVAEIARAVPGPVSDKTLMKREPDGLLRRGKSILDVLRG